jgi:uncharacterized membrane protein YhaH (DUF805 family)
VAIHILSYTTPIHFLKRLFEVPPVLHFVQLLAQENNSSNAAGSVAGLIGGCFFLVIYLAVVVVVLAGMWKVFVKAGKPGWAALIPFYNTYVFCEIGGKPGWWLILFFIPLVGLIFAIMVTAGVARNFGKGIGFLLGMIFLPFIFYLILGFGSARYQPTTSSAFPVTRV